MATSSVTGSEAGPSSTVGASSPSGLTVLVAVVTSAMAFSGKTNDKFSVPGTESQQAQELLEQKYPAASGTYARLRVRGAGGEKLSDAENKAAVEATLAQGLAGFKDVSAVTEPVRDQGDHAGRARRVRRHDLPRPGGQDRRLRHVTSSRRRRRRPREAGLQIEFGGGLVTDESHANSESLGMMVGFLVLAITLGSLLAASLPMLTAIIGVSIGLVGLHGAHRRDRGVRDGADPGDDARPRRRHRLRAVHPHPLPLEPAGRAWKDREAAAHATATAGSAVVFAGATVVIALVGLLVVNIPFLTVMGMAAAGTVSIAVLIALTLLPAILRLRQQARRAAATAFVSWRPRPPCRRRSTR